jgi:hypothetical protein
MLLRPGGPLALRPRSHVGHDIQHHDDVRRHHDLRHHHDLPASPAGGPPWRHAPLLRQSEQPDDLDDHQHGNDNYNNNDNTEADIDVIDDN